MQVVVRLCLLIAVLFLASPSSVTGRQTRTVAIHEIQGPGASSPLAGQLVATSGIVTGVKTNGFFMQAPDAEVDSDPRTSEGIFVFTSTAPMVNVGQRVSVTGTVQEFRLSSTPFALPLTEITGPSIVATTSNNPLPAAVTITSPDLNSAGPLDQLERLEGMRVRIEQLVVVGPTDGNVDEKNAIATSTGVFFGVLAGFARPFREPGLEALDPMPEGAPCCVPRFDGNPERIRIDSRALPSNTGIALEVAAGASLSGLEGILDYAQSNYTLLLSGPRPGAPALPTAAPVSSPASDQFTIASFNLERFFDTTDDPTKSDVVLTQAAFDLRLNKASLAIRTILRMPDILGVEEVENLSALQALAAKINADAVAAGAPNPNYQAVLFEGNDPGGIDVGFLVKTARVTVQSATQIGKDATYIDPSTNQPATLNDRPPVLLQATLPASGGGTFAITVIVNHLRSLLGMNDPATGNRVRAKRRAQAEFLANLIQSRQSADPNEKIVSIGDYNSYGFSDGYVDTINTIKGTPPPANQVALASADLVNPDLINLGDFAPQETSYSYSFDGNAQTIDHILVSSNLFRYVSRLEVAHCNADFPESLRGTATRPERISDHDMPIAFINLTPAPAIATSVSAASFRIRALPGNSIVAAFGTGMASATLGASSLPLPTTLGDTTVKILDRAGIERLAPLFYVSPNQIDYLMPAEVASGPAVVTITRGAATALAGTVVIDSVGPGLFTANDNGSGVPAANLLRVQANGAQTTEPVARFDAASGRYVSVPIDLGPATDQVFLILFGTGWRSRASLGAVSVRVGGLDADATYAGAQGSFAGLDQLNVLLPRGLAGRGDVDLVVTVEGRAANVVRVNVK